MIPLIRHKQQPKSLKEMSMKKKKPQQNLSPCKPTSSIKPSINQPKLSQQFITKLLAQQQQCKKKLTQQGILSLVSMYKKLVQHYTSKQDTIALYFTQKMLNVMCSQAAIETYEPEAQRMTVSMVEERTSSIGEEFKKREVQQLVTAEAYDRETKKKERAKKVQIFMEVKKTQKRANARNIINKYYEECVDNNAMAMGEIEKQRKDLEDRLKAIHQKSLNDDDAQLAQNGQNVQNLQNGHNRQNPMNRHPTHSDHHIPIRNKSSSQIFSSYINHLH